MTTNDTAVAGGITTMRCDKFRGMVDALATLSRKTLPTAVAEMKVALMLKAYQPIFDVTTDTAQKMEKKHTRTEGEKVQIINPLGLRDKREKFNATMIRVKVPKQLLTAEDLPKASGDATAEDMKNRESTATIITLLGPLFDLKADADARELLYDSVLDDDAAAAFAALADESVPEPATLDAS